VRPVKTADVPSLAKSVKGLRPTTDSFRWNPGSRSWS
jgi:hypothetical protein